jgi:hypothetical protein
VPHTAMFATLGSVDRAMGLAPGSRSKTVPHVETEPDVPLAYVVARRMRTALMTTIRAVLASNAAAARDSGPSAGRLPAWSLPRPAPMTTILAPAARASAIGPSSGL